MSPLVTDSDLAAIDLFVAVSVSFRLLYVMIILTHRRRRSLRKRGAVSHGNASIACCASHAAVGCCVTSNRTILLRQPLKRRSLHGAARHSTTVLWDLRQPHIP